MTPVGNCIRTWRGDHEGDENELSRVNIAATLCRCVFFVLAPGVCEGCSHEGGNTSG